MQTHDTAPGWGLLLTILAVALLEGAHAFQLPASPILGACAAQKPRFSRPPMSARALRTARLGPRMSEGSGAEEGLTDADLKGLMLRVAETRSRVDEVPILVLDSMLPRQRLMFDTADPSFKALADAATTGSFGMLGVDYAAQSMLRYGTAVDLTRKDVLPDRLSVTIVGRRRFALLGEPWVDSRGFFMARVEYLDESADEWPVELGGASDAVLGAVGAADRSENAKACAELDELVRTWTELVVGGGRERQPGQVGHVLEDLGPMPPPSQPRERAMWVAALINPLPALGVSLEIRPAVLSAPTAGAALGVVLAGIKSSIGHLDGSQPLW